jgi:hypothetical protein
MKKTTLIFCCFLLFNHAYCQKYHTEKGAVTFFSDGVIEDITAVNTAVGSMFNSASGELVFIVPIKDFKFNKSLMREHFNEKYMETDKFAKSIFLGKLVGFSLNAKGSQKVKAIGTLTMHGITKEIEVPGTVEFVNGRAVMQSKFIVKLKDYHIKIPSIVWQNIAEEVEVSINFTYKTL